MCTRYDISSPQYYFLFFYLLDNFIIRTLIKTQSQCFLSRITDTFPYFYFSRKSDGALYRKSSSSSSSSKSKLTVESLTERLTILEPPISTAFG